MRPFAIVDNGGGTVSPKLITFTIESTDYQAEEGMTWREFVDSEYNAYNRVSANGTSGLVYFDGISYNVTNSNNSPDYVYASDVIQSTTYYLYSERPD